MAETSSGLVRSIGRWSLAALIVNSVIGGGVFGLPSVVAGRLGKYGPVAYLVAAGGIALIAACLSEVASQFRETGGPYLYARAALGRFWGIQIAWMTWLARLTAASGTANLFATYLAEFSPARGAPVLSRDDSGAAHRDTRGNQLSRSAFGDAGQRFPHQRKNTFVAVVYWRRAGLVDDAWRGCAAPLTTSGHLA